MGDLSKKRKARLPDGLCIRLIRSMMQRFRPIDHIDEMVLTNEVGGPLEDGLSRNFSLMRAMPVKTEKGVVLVSWTTHVQVGLLPNIDIDNERVCTTKEIMQMLTR